MEKEYLTIQDVAKYLSIKTSTIYTKIGEIPHYKIGRLLTFKKQDIDAWIETKRETAPTQKIRTRPSKKNVPDANRIIRKAIDAAKEMTSWP